jgi:hypothetical protein
MKSARELSPDAICGDLPIRRVYSGDNEYASMQKMQVNGVISKYWASDVKKGRFS